MVERKGRCMCGAVTVRATPVRSSMSACHCDMCRQWTSSMLMTVQAAPGYSVSGPVRTFASSEWAERAFCDTCGSALWYRITAPGALHGQTQMAAGLFDNSAGAALKLEYFIDQKPDGFAFAGEHRRMTGAEVMASFAPPETNE